jgi:hypothetical protein
MNTKNSKTKLCIVIGLVLALSIGYFVFRGNTPAPPPTANVVTEYKDTTTIQYIPKTSKNDSDVEVNKALPKVSVAVNGTQHSMDLVQGETQKFDKGKIVVDQSSTLTVDVSAEVEAQVEHGIAKAFAQQSKKPRVKLGIEGSVDSGVKADVNLRISRQSEDLDIDIRVNQSKQSIAITKWF